MERTVAIPDSLPLPTDCVVPSDSPDSDLNASIIGAQHTDSQHIEKYHRDADHPRLRGAYFSKTVWLRVEPGRGSPPRTGKDFGGRSSTETTIGVVHPRERGKTPVAPASTQMGSGWFTPRTGKDY